MAKRKKVIKLTDKLILETVKEVVGEDVLPIVKFLKNRKNLSEFIISEKTCVEIHLVRNILYRLNQQNIASYTRKKDSKKGYYISYWTFEPKKIKDLLKVVHKRKLEKLKERLAIEEANRGTFYLCSNACTRVNFHDGIELSFKCPDCGELLYQQDNSRTIEYLRDRIKEMEA